MAADLTLVWHIVIYYSTSLKTLPAWYNVDSLQMLQVDPME